MRNGDVTPIVDADTVRRAVASAQDEVCGALRCVAARLGAGASGLSVHERQEARTLDELACEASQLHAVQAASSDAQLLTRAGSSRRAPTRSSAASASCRPSRPARPPTTSPTTR